jgi:hypothetical protein
MSRTIFLRRSRVIARILGFIGALLIPAGLAAQEPSIPNEHASARAKERVATRVRGEAVGLDNRPVTPATPATRATRATPAVPNPDGGPATRAIPAVPATPAVPASPSRRPDNPGQGGNRRP